MYETTITRRKDLSTGKVWEYSVKHPAPASDYIAKNGHPIQTKEPLKRVRRNSPKGYKTKTGTCIHCGKTGGISGITRWHNDNCKYRKE